MEEEKTNRLKKADEKERHRRKDDCRENLIASKDNNFHFALYPNPEKKACGLTVCVTRAGAGGGTPSDWENAEA